MKHRHKMAKAKGGKVKMNEYNAKGSPEVREAEDHEDSFKRGGHKKGGKVHGTKSAHRLDKRARGGAMKKSPFSEGHHGKNPDTKPIGHCAEQPEDAEYD